MGYFLLAVNYLGLFMFVFSFIISSLYGIFPVCLLFYALARYFCMFIWGFFSPECLLKFVLGCCLFRSLSLS